jgi:hypothetical protein
MEKKKEMEVFESWYKKKRLILVDRKKSRICKADISAFTDFKR